MPGLLLAGIQSHRVLEGRNRFPRPIGAKKTQPQKQVRSAEVRPELERFAKGLDGLLILTELEVAQRNIVVRLGKLRVQAKRLRIARYRFFELAFLLRLFCRLKVAGGVRGRALLASAERKRKEKHCGRQQKFHFNSFRDVRVTPSPSTILTCWSAASPSTMSFVPLGHWTSRRSTLVAAPSPK